MVSNLSQISRYALLSDAAYTDFVSKKTGLPFSAETAKSDIAEALAARLSSQGKGKKDEANTNAVQVKLVADNYTLVAHQPDTDSGFSVTLFQDNATQEYVLAFRGTQGRQDLFGADIGDIVADGLAVDQIIDMLHIPRPHLAFWHRLDAAAGGVGAYPD